MTKIATVCGEIDSSALGRTLMHEHLVIGYPGFQSHTTRPGPSRDEMFAVCVDRIESLKALGFSSMLDPCPSDLGRDVELAARVARATGFNIIVATGLYKQSEGGVPYWHFRSQFGPIVSGQYQVQDGLFNQIDADATLQELGAKQATHLLGGTLELESKTRFRVTMELRTLERGPSGKWQYGHTLPTKVEFTLGTREWN